MNSYNKFKKAYTSENFFVSYAVWAPRGPIPGPVREPSPLQSPYQVQWLSHWTTGATHQIYFDPLRKWLKRHPRSYRKISSAPVALHSWGIL